VNESRARRVDLSKDLYSREWIPADMRTSVANLWDKFSSQVYQFDDIVLSIRNRFFSGLVEEASRHGSSVIVAPCGLTSYPYLTATRTRFLEIDLPDVIRYKTERAASLCQEVGFPQRDICRMELDLRSVDDFAKAIKQFRHETRLLVIVEGFSYYLEHEEWQNFVEHVLAVLQPGDRFAFDYWSESDEYLPAYARYKEFCAQYASFRAQTFNFLKEDEFAALLGRCEFTRTSVIDMEKELVGTSILASNKGEIIIDRYCVAMCT
jgi:O-methyltransferase involved in polyketide biosynthesis